MRDKIISALVKVHNVNRYCNARLLDTSLQTTGGSREGCVPGLKPVAARICLALSRTVSCVIVPCGHVAADTDGAVQLASRNGLAR